MQQMNLSNAGCAQSARGHAQDRSRSPGGAAGSPAQLAMSGVGHHAVETAAYLGAVAEDSAWFTGDTTLDFGVLKSIVAPSIRGGLSLIPKDERKTIIRQCMTRQAMIRHLPGYFQGCIRKAISAQEFGRTVVNPAAVSTPDVRTVARLLVHVASPLSAEASRAPALAQSSPSPHASEGAALGAGAAPVASGASAHPSSNSVSASNDVCEIPSWVRGCLSASSLSLIHI